MASNDKVPIESTDINKLTFVYDNVEVRKTGRVAHRTVAGAVAYLVEICPAEKDGIQWKKWVKPTDLYEIRGL